ncbi:serine/threonine-protein kinase [Streptomyces sp. NPDC059355]|uniref:serine/threonine-protein kinase n=1 Tax=Streptomyces sp. NPDC059355 TaxID=3346811 RepID=UPI0036B5077D
MRAESDVAVAEIHRRTARPAAPAKAPVRPVQHDPLLPGDPRRIGRYRLTARLGEGGMGTAYLGLSPGERRVAVKVVRADLAADPGFRKRFAREIDSVRRVGGFHTAQVVDASSEGEQPWLVTEYIPGPSLAAVLREYGALPARTVRTLALGVAEALEGIHARGIVHRDLKPGNIIIAETGARVIDFGIARAVDATALTRTDYFVGTQGFLAPEQLTGAPLTPAVDAYAFGMVLGHACGAAPIPARNRAGVGPAAAARRPVGGREGLPLTRPGGPSGPGADPGAPGRRGREGGRGLAAPGRSDDGRSAQPAYQHSWLRRRQTSTTIFPAVRPV